MPVRVAEATKVRVNPASYDNHVSQARQFWLSMSTIEREHIVRAYTFELGKCLEQAIKERQLLVLAYIDPVVCQEVATGLGLPAREPTVPLLDLDPSPALSQLGGSSLPTGAWSASSSPRTETSKECARCAWRSTALGWCRC